MENVENVKLRMKNVEMTARVVFSMGDTSLNGEL
jgi:hypothetical protein